MNPADGHSSHGPIVPITPVDLDFYHNEGYLIVPGAFCPDRIAALVEAVEKLIDREMSGGCEIGWIDRENRVLGRTEHLLSPERYDPAFGEWLDQDLAPHLHHLIAGGQVRHSLFGLMGSGAGQSYTQLWHRDLCRGLDADEAVFLQRHHGKVVQFNAPLLPGDHFLQIVPNSHLRPSTPTEIEIAAALADHDEMPGVLIVMLEPGDVVYYDPNLWHRGWNPDGQCRWTMHAAFWNADYPVMRHENGQRDQLQNDTHLECLPPITRQYIQRYLDQYTDKAVDIVDL